MQPKRYIVWSKNKIDLNDSRQKKVCSFDIEINTS